MTSALTKVRKPKSPVSKAASKTNAALSESFGPNRKPQRLTYALKQQTAERRPDGWWVCRTPFTAVGEKPEWVGPFSCIETACLALARQLATEIANRHTVHIQTYQLLPGDPLIGLKPTTNLERGNSVV